MDLRMLLNANFMRVRIRQALAVCVLSLTFGMMQPSADAQTECTVSVNGQIVFVGAFGSRFNLRNIPAGPDLIRACVICDTEDGKKLYGQTDIFQIIDNESFVSISDFKLSETPLTTVSTIRAAPVNGELSETLTSTRIIVTATLSDGTTKDISTRLEGTTYRTSNPKIATVSKNGFVTVAGRGTALITATNSGATAVTRVVVALDDPLTTVEGIVELADGTRVAGATVSIQGQSKTATTDSNGRFLIPNVLTVLGNITITVANEQLVGTALNLKPILAGVTDGGIIQIEIPDNEGKEFIVVFQENLELEPAPLSLTLFISSNESSAGTVEIPGIGFSTNFSVVPGVVTSVSIPEEARVIGGNIITNLGILVTVDRPVSVYGLNQKQFSTDAFAALPVETFDTRYRVMSYTVLGGVLPSQFAVVASEDNTVVTITPSASTANHAAGIPFNVFLNRLEVFQLGTILTDVDLTGSVVTSDKPVGLFSGHSCANVPVDVGFCDHLCEQLPPVSTWGQQALTLPIETRLNGDTIRILADQDNTNVQIAGSTPESFSLNAGQFAERILQGNNDVSADKPILVTQYSNGTDFDGVTSDPFMFIVPPSEQFLTSYTFATPGDGFTTNFVNVVAPADDVQSGNVLLDTVPIPLSEWSVIGSSGFSCAKVSISVGSHTIAGDQPLGIYVYGFADFNSYGYPGGLGLTVIP